MPRKLSILLPVSITATTVAFAIGTPRSPEQATATQTPIVRGLVTEWGRATARRDRRTSELIRRGQAVLPRK